MVLDGLLASSWSEIGLGSHALHTLQRCHVTQRSCLPFQGGTDTLCRCAWLIFLSNMLFTIIRHRVYFLHLMFMMISITLCCAENTATVHGEYLRRAEGDTAAAMHLSCTEMVSWIRSVGSSLHGRGQAQASSGRTPENAGNDEALACQVVVET